MNRSHPLKTLNTLIFYTSCVLLLASCWQRNHFPADLAVAADLLQAPAQHTISASPFTVTNEDVTYRIEPRYQYDLKGLVVSYAHHDGNYSLHRLWNDHINVADICVVWSDNAQELDLNRFRFWNGKFTCNFETDDAAAWKRFRPDQISNNHLLTDDVSMRQAISKVRVGDQVHIRGWLANYSNNTGFSRGTSTTRTDTGNGACETIYVNDFRILETMQSGWRTLLKFSLFGVISTSLIWLVAVLHGRF